MLYRDCSEDCHKETKEREDEKQIGNNHQANWKAVKNVDLDPKGQQAEI